MVRELRVTQLGVTVNPAEHPHPSSPQLSAQTSAPPFPPPPPAWPPLFPCGLPGTNPLLTAGPCLSTLHPSTYPQTQSINLLVIPQPKLSPRLLHSCAHPTICIFLQEALPDSSVHPELD